jgi:hypothetical protein
MQGSMNIVQYFYWMISVQYITMLSDQLLQMFCTLWFIVSKSFSEHLILLYSGPQINNLELRASQSEVHPYT